MSIELSLSCSYPKLYFERKLDRYRSPYSDPFEYQSILDKDIPDSLYSDVLATGTERFAGISDRIERGKNHLRALIEHADKAFEPRYWWTAYLGGEPIGLVFPQFIPDLKNVGSVWHIGVCNVYRGSGYGRILHAHALEALSVLGANRYLGSTQVDNYAMIKVFEANGCNFKSFRIIEEFTNGDGRALD